MQFTNHNHYIGDWVRGVREGHGTFYYASGAVYTGGWVHNRKHGKGVYHPNSNTKIDVSFVHDQLETHVPLYDATYFDASGLLANVFISSSSVSPELLPDLEEDEWKEEQTHVCAHCWIL